MSELLELAGRLETRAKQEHEIAANSAVVCELLQPQLDAFNRRDGTHNTYAVRLMLDHRNSTKKDASFAADLDAAAAFIRDALTNSEGGGE